MKQNDTKFRWDSKEAAKPERTIVIVPDMKTRRNERDAANQHPASDGVNFHKPTIVRSIETRIDEAVGLANAIELNVCHSMAVNLRNIRPSTLFGKGKTEEIRELVHDNDAGLVIIDQSITPVQQQNLEKEWQCKILDRTGLILEIFSARAKTREGSVQVELAHLNYQKGRLVRSWTHLERQRGGLGFVGGPGETQIEADRRMIRERIGRLEAQLKKIQRTRTLHRSKRQKIPYPVIALVGYTNAGKSTLFNKLTGANVFAKDLLFATLDPTLRQLVLPKGNKVIFSDTVGFISNLPTHLIAAFRATLEEVIEAELILHVRDISDPDTEAHAAEVLNILEQIGIDKNQTPIIELWNKVDLFDDQKKEALINASQSNSNNPHPISAITGLGLNELQQVIENKLFDEKGFIEVDLGLSSLDKLDWIYKNTQVLKRKDNEDGTISLQLRANPKLRDTINSITNPT